MIIEREKYINPIKNAINDPSIKCIVLDGPRHAGKTTILKQLYSDDTIQRKKYYFSFDDQISIKQFKDSHEFISFMQIKFGIDFFQEGLLFLNEIQFSKNIGNIIHDLIAVHQINTKIIATGITHGEYKDFLKLHKEDFTVINVHTLDFMEFLTFKGIHTQHINPLQFSRIIFDEIYPLAVEFLTWGGYPSVVAAKTEEEKKDALRHIIHLTISKDVSFWFQKEEISYFETILHIINDQHARIHNKRAIKNNYEIPTSLIDKYTRFLEDHGLTINLNHFFSNKDKEVSHKKISMLLDMGIKNYLNNSFSINLLDPIVMVNCVLQEIYKNIAPEENILTYKKINGSSIDLIITRNDKILPVVVGERNTDSVPKVFVGFDSLYAKDVDCYIKTSPSRSTKNIINGKEVYVLPYFLIGKFLLK